MLSNFTFFDWCNLLAIVLILVADYIILRFVIPLQRNQARVQNGLIKLREQLLVRQKIGLVAENAALAILAIRMVFRVTGIFSGMTSLIMILFGILLIVFTGGHLVKARIDEKIYHQDFSPKSVRKHARIARLEKAEVKREKK